MAPSPTQTQPDAPASPDATVLTIGKASPPALVSASDLPVGQLAQIKTWIAGKPSGCKFDVLPPTSSFTCTAGETIENQRWAVVSTFSTKYAEALFANEYRVGAVEMVAELGDMALMCPFRVFKKGGGTYTLRQLKHLILYLFLGHGCVEKGFHEGLGTAGDVLSSAASRIHNGYTRRGEKNIQGLHGPSGDLTFVRQKRGPRMLAQERLAVYDKEVMTVISEEDIEDSAAEEKPASVNKLAPPHDPHDENIAGDDIEDDPDNIESQPGSISVTDVSPTTKKRSRDEDSGNEDHWAKCQRIIDIHQRLSRKEATLKDQRLKLDAQLVMVVARKTEADEELRRVVKAMSKPDGLLCKGARDLKD